MERIALLPGGFKPPHAGHYNMAIWLAENTDAKTIVIKVGAKERDGVTREISLQLWNLYRINDPNPTAKKLSILPSNSNSPVQDVYDFVEKEAPEDSTIYLGMGEKDINDKRFANIGKFAEPKGIKFETILVPPQAGGVSGTDMRKFIKSGDKESFLKYIPDFLPKEQKDRAWELVTGLEEDLYNPEDKVLDYMKSSEFKAGMPDGPKDDIEPSYKYKRGGVYGRMYNEEISPTDLNNIDTFADKQLDPVDVDLTSNHFFDRLNDPRNDKDISNAELIGFFKRLGKKKKDLLDFLTKYKEIVASDSRTDINIPFLKQADKIIAKTIMRKKDFQTSSPQLALERDLSDKEEKIAQDLPDKEFKKRKEASKKKTQRMKKEGTFTKDWWKKIINEVLIVEGGAAGHMAHPFNLPNVNNGKSLLDVFKKSSDSLDKKPGAIKIDGVNSSIRLIDIDGKKQFVMDRGSKKPLDLKGITKDDLLDRFGKGHGMVKIGGEVLDMFNEALPAIQNDLKKLGAFDDPNILFNMEYVSGKTNVQDYGSNFIAIHGLNKIESKEIQGKRGPLTKRISSEVSYSKDDLQSLLDNLKPTAKKRGYEVYGSVPTTMNKKPNFNAALSKNYTVNAGESSETKSLGQWLNALDNIPEEDFIFMNVGYKTGSSTVNNKKVGAVSKQVYLAILNGENIDGLFDDAEDRKKAIQGFVTYLATEKLGDEVLKVLDSPMGSADKHEGVVIRDESIAKVPFKITGKFILGGMVSDF